MKKFLILFTLIAFSAVSCVGPQKMGWMGPGDDFRHDKFEEDRAECVQSIDPGLYSEAFGQALEECLARRGYKYEPLDSVSSKQASSSKGEMGEWKKPDFSQAEFEKDREECEQAIWKDVEHPLTVAECLAKKGYAFDKKKSVTVLQVLGISAAIVLIAGLMVVTSGAAAPLLWAAGISP